MINIVGSSRYKVNKKALKEHLKSLMAESGISPQETLNVALVGKRKMKEISATYKHEDVALPVLAFPYRNSPSRDNLFGEIVICYPQAVLLAAERNKRVEEMMKQLLTHAFRNLLK